MRTSILTRSAVAVATLAVGSVALAAVPATAATPSGITRETVLTAVNGIRAAGPDSTDYSDATQAALDELIAKACDFPAVGSNRTEGFGVKAVTPGSADGIVVSVYLHENPTGASTSHRLCNFGALVPTDSSATLTGDATITVTTAPFDQTLRAAAAPQTTSSTTKLSGDVAVTANVGLPDDQLNGVTTADLSASGEAVKTLGGVVTKKIWDNKSRAEKSLAKKKYDKRIARAKQTYKKAVSRAGGDNAKKAVAKKVYAAQRAAYQRKYNLAVWNYRYVKEDGTTTARSAFKVSASTQVQYFD